MLISIVLAWLTVLCCLMTAVKWIARKSGNKRVNRAFHKIHIPFGCLAVLFGLLHGILAGNLPGDTLATMQPGAVLFSLNAGTFAFLLIVLLALSFCFRKRLPFSWMKAHRVLTLALAVLLVLHLVNTGITLPGRISEALSNQNTESVESAESSQSVQAEEGAAEATADAVEPDSAAASVEAPAEPDADASEEQGAQVPDSAADVSSENEQQEDASVADEELAAETAGMETEETTAADSEPVTFSGAVLKDGTYTGSADGFNGTITVTVTVASGSVTDITIDDESDTPRFFESASGITDTVLEEQSLAVDVVSGATFSSSGILNAVYNALSDAVVSGELEITEVDLSSIHGHGPH